MKRLLILILSGLIFQINASAQCDSVTFAKMPDGTELKAPCLTFHKYGCDFSVSEDHDLVAVTVGVKDKKGMFKTSGELCMYDLRSGQLLWSRPVQLNGGLRSKYGPDIHITHYGLLMVNNNQVELVDSRTQAPLWKEKLYMLMQNDSLDIVMGYQTPASSKLKALQLSTGRTLWNAKVPTKPIGDGIER